MSVHARDFADISYVFSVSNSSRAMLCLFLAAFSLYSIEYSKSLRLCKSTGISIGDGAIHPWAIMTQTVTHIRQELPIGTNLHSCRIEIIVLMHVNDNTIIMIYTVMEYYHVAFTIHYANRLLL